MTTALDRRFYPHLFDLVVAHAPPASLIRLRGTCHELRRRVDAIFAHSLVIHVHDTYRRGESVTTHLGLAPFLYSIGTDGRLPPKGGRKPQRQARERLVNLLEGVQVVDIVGHGGHMYEFVLQGHISPEVVRYPSNPPGYRDQPWCFVPTVIQFCHFKQENDSPPFATLSIEHVSRSGSKLVFNIPIDHSIDELPHAVIDYAMVDEVDADPVEEMVVIFTLDTTRPPNPAWSKGRAARGSSMGFIDVLLDSIVDQMESLGVVKLVNLTQLDPALLGVRGPMSPDEIRERVSAELKRRARLVGDGEVIGLIETNVHFLTEAEYVATLSPEEEALETDPALMGTHLVWGGEDAP